MEPAHDVTALLNQVASGRGELRPELIAAVCAELRTFFAVHRHRSYTRAAAELARASPGIRARACAPARRAARRAR